MPKGAKGNRERLKAIAGEIVWAFRDGTGITTLCEQYQCGYEIMRKAIAHGLTDAEYKTICKRHCGKGGVRTRFQKGHRTWNKNMRGIHLSPATEFKKGHLPQTHKPVGRISIRRHKGVSTRWIKVSGEKQGKHRWITLAQWIWERKHGPVPKGMFVIHKDGNTLHDVEENLMLVDQRANMQRTRALPGVEERRRRTMAKAQKERWKRYRAAKRKQHDPGEKTHERQLKAAKRPAEIVLWMCSACGNTSIGEQAPTQCKKCSRGGFERNVIPQRLVV